MPMKGAQKHIARLRKLSGRDIDRIGGAITYEGADMIKTEAFRLVSAGSISGKDHVASAPGQAPNRDTGDLQAGFKAVQTGKTSAEFRAETSYSAALEFGTSKMEARPFVRPARDNKVKEIRARYESQIDALVKRSG